MILPVNYNLMLREKNFPAFSGNILSTFFRHKKELPADEYTKEGDESGVRCLLSKREQERLVSIIDLKMPDKIGTDADFYTVDNYGIKKVAKQDAGVLINEDKALRYLAKSGISNIPKTRGIFFDTTEVCLVTNIKEGNSADIQKGNFLSNENLNELFSIFLDMDKLLFSHNDLHMGNILIDGETVNLIDFGAYSIVSDAGNVIEENEIDFNKNVTMKPRKRLQRLISKAARGEKRTGLDFSDNPNLPFNSSLSNFEYRFVSDYLRKYETVDKEGARKFFRDYLKIKGEYYKKRANYYDKMINNFGNNLSKNYLRQAVLYDMASSNVLESNNREAIIVERMKMDFKALLYLKKSEIKNVPAEELIELYDALMAQIDKILSQSKDNDLILYAESLKKIYSNPYWMWEIENPGTL